MGNLFARHISHRTVRQCTAAIFPPKLRLISETNVIFCPSMKHQPNRTIKTSSQLRSTCWLQTQLKWQRKRKVLIQKKRNRLETFQCLPNQQLTLNWLCARFDLHVSAINGRPIDTGYLTLVDILHDVFMKYVIDINSQLSLCLRCIAKSFHIRTIFQRLVSIKYSSNRELSNVFVWLSPESTEHLLLRRQKIPVSGHVSFRFVSISLFHALVCVSAVQWNTQPK